MRQWSWAWRRKIQKYAQETEAVVGMEKENSEIYPRNRSVVGMEKENSEICPESKSGSGYGEGKFRNMPKKQKRRGHGGGKFRNMPKKQEWSWVWRRKIQKYTQETRVVVGMEKENSEICPESKSGRGHGEGKIRNMPKKQKRSWAWKGKY